MAIESTTVKHYLYCSSGNSHDLEEHIGFFEIADDDYCTRYLEIRSDGIAVRYTEQHAADGFGILPEGPWQAADAAKPEFGTLSAISAQLFDAAWDGVQCCNGQPSA